MSRHDRYKQGDVTAMLQHTDDCDAYIATDDCFDPPHPPTATCTPVPLAALPHQCDAWTIGGAAEVEQMIADLTALLPALREPE